MPRLGENTNAYRAGVCKMFARLADGPATYAELTQASGMVMSTVVAWVGAMRAQPHPHARDKQIRLVRICAYDKSADGRANVNVFEFNHEGLRDAKKPTPKKPAQRTRDYRKRQVIAALSSALCSPLTGPQCQHTDSGATEGA